MSTAYKTQIKKIVKEYIGAFPNDYATFIQWMNEQRHNAANDFDEIKGSEMVGRKLFEMPEDLYAMMKVNLDDGGFTWFRSKDGAQWFAQTFPKFRSSKKV